MSTEKLTEKPIVNIVRTEIVTEEDVPKTYRFDTASEATYAAVVSEGKETVLRVKNEIKAINRTEDIQYGSDINFSQVVVVPEVLAIIDGGTITKQTEKLQKYTPPVVGSPVNRTLFTLKIYTEEKEWKDHCIKEYFDEFLSLEIADMNGRYQLMIELEDENGNKLPYFFVDRKEYAKRKEAMEKCIQKNYFICDSAVSWKFVSAIV